MVRLRIKNFVNLILILLFCFLLIKLFILVVFFKEYIGFDIFSIFFIIFFFIYIGEKKIIFLDLFI